MTQTQRTTRAPATAATPRSGLQIHDIAGILVAFGISVALIVVAYDEAKTSTSHGHFAVFWLGLFFALAGTTYGGYRAVTNRHAALILALYGVLTFLPKLLMSRNGPVYFDEFGHLRHVQDMLATGQIGVKNPFLAVVQYYPVLGLLTEGVHDVTRLNLWHSGQVIVLVSHCAALLLVRALGLAFGFERRAAFFAALVFSANPSYLYFDSQYAYETLGIPLLLATVLCCLRARNAPTSRQGTLFAIGGSGFSIAITFTHHITAVVTLAFCILVSVFAPTYGYPGDPETRAHIGAKRRFRQSWLVSGVMAAGVVIWVLGYAATTRSYLFPSIRRSFSQVRTRFFGSSAPPPTGSGSPTQATQAQVTHTPFAGTNVPAYERYMALGLPFIVLLVALYAVWRTLRSDNRGRELRLGAPVFIFTAAYFVSLPVALTAGGNEAAHRSWPFLYAGVALTAAWTFGRMGGVPRLAPQNIGVRTGLTSVVLLALLIGNTTAGTNIIYRFPGPYVFGSDGRFQTAELSQVTSWADKNLPTGAGVVTDRFTAQSFLVGTRLRLPNSTEGASYGLYHSPQTPNAQLRGFLKSHNFEYFVLDLRITTELPSRSFFQTYRSYRQSVSPQLLANIFDSPFIQLVHSSQNYRVFHLNP